MSWLDSIEREFVYSCDGCGEKYVDIRKTGDVLATYKKDRECPSCGGTAHFSRILPLKINIGGKVAFEHNGVKGYAISDGKGGVQYRSASKEHWLDTGEIKPHYNPAYEAHLRKTGQSHMLQETNANEIMKKRQENKKLSEQYDKRIQAAKDSHLRSES